MLRRPLQPRYCCLLVQVPVGTSVRILDRIFAREPQLKPQHLLEHLSSQGLVTPGDPAAKLPEPSIDTTVSASTEALVPVFAHLRRLQAEAGLPQTSPLTLDRQCSLQRIEGRRGKCTLL